MIETRTPVPGVLASKVNGTLTVDDVSAWRTAAEAFIKANEKRGTCGIFIEVTGVQSMSTAALDAVLAILAEPEELSAKTRLRFALIGVKPFTQRFLRAVMPPTPVPHMRARFFHEVSRKEAVAWLQSGVGAAETTSQSKRSSDKTTEKPEKKKAAPPAPTLKPEEKGSASALLRRLGRAKDDS